MALVQHRLQGSRRNGCLANTPGTEITDMSVPLVSRLCNLRKGETRALYSPQRAKRRALSCFSLWQGYVLRVHNPITPCIHHSWYKIEMTHLVVLLARSSQTCICLALTTVIGRHLLRMTWALLMCFEKPGGFASLHVATKELWHAAWTLQNCQPTFVHQLAVHSYLLMIQCDTYSIY